MIQAPLGSKGNSNYPAELMIMHRAYINISFVLKVVYTCIEIQDAILKTGQRQTVCRIAELFNILRSGYIYNKCTCKI